MIFKCCFTVFWSFTHFDNQFALREIQISFCNVWDKDSTPGIKKI